jgi:hypothetical protein
VARTKEDAEHEMDQVRAMTDGYVKGRSHRLPADGAGRRSVGIEERLAAHLPRLRQALLTDVEA